MVGRRKEIDILERMYDSDESEFVALYGRRRVGKTYLVRETFEERLTFSFSGYANVGLKVQLRNFSRALEDYGVRGKAPKTWEEAFEGLRRVVELSHQKKKVLFIDELPWLDTQRSGFVPALEGFWNGWASARKDILLIVCGSAAGWMVKHLFHNRGGLHNRVTCRINLQPFTLHECELFARQRGLAFTRADLAECYMALGGIPYYWRYLDKRYGVARNFDAMFFEKGAPLAGEFNELYASLFKDAASYRKVVSALAGKKSGMSREALVKIVGSNLSSSLGTILETLESSGFVRSYSFFGCRKRNAVYQLVDNFTLFHFHFLVDKGDDESFWSSQVDGRRMSTWRGLSFERLCLQHVKQVRAALGVESVHVNAYAWYHQSDDVYPQGVQIDLLLDRADHVINLCEMKYYADPYALDKKDLNELERKRSAFRAVTGTSKSILLTLLTSKGLIKNAYANSIQVALTLDDLFAD